MRFLTSRDSSRARDNNHGEIESTMKRRVQITWEDNEFLANPLHSEDIAPPYRGFFWVFPTSFKRYLGHGTLSIIIHYSRQNRPKIARKHINDGMYCIYWLVNARASQNARVQSCIESTFESRSIIRLVIPLYANRPQGIYDAQSLQKSVTRSIVPQFSTDRKAVLRNA